MQLVSGGGRIGAKNFLLHLLPWELGSSSTSHCSLESCRSHPGGRMHALMTAGHPGIRQPPGPSDAQGVLSALFQKHQELPPLSLCLWSERAERRGRHTVAQDKYHRARAGRPPAGLMQTVRYAACRDRTKGCVPGPVSGAPPQRVQLNHEAPTSPDEKS